MSGIHENDEVAPPQSLSLETAVTRLSEAMRDLAAAETAAAVLRLAVRHARVILGTRLTVASSAGELAAESSGDAPHLTVTLEQLAPFDPRHRGEHMTEPRGLALPEPVLVAPIPSGETATSVLLAAGPLAREFTAADEALLQQIAQMASLALARSIEESARVAKRLIEDLAEFSRSSTRRMRLDPEELDLGAIAALTLDDIAPAAKRKGISLEPPNHPGILISADATRLRQAIWNVLTNAVKFTPEGGTIQVRLAESSGEVRLSVADSGIGIEPSFLPYVFEPFRQHRPGSGEGLGLGLAIVKQIMEAHGGNVWAESGGTGHGAVIVMRFPRAQEPNESASMPT